MPPSQDLLTAAAVLNAWEAPQLGRAWQLMLLRTGSLTLNGVRHPYGTVAIDHDRYELRPRDPALPRFITTGAGKGWALVGVVQDGAVIALRRNGIRLEAELEHPSAI